MEVRQSFAIGQTVTVLTDEEIVFVGTIICCEKKFKCDICDDRLTIKENCDKEKEKEKEHKEKEHKKENDHDCDTFLVLQLEEDVEIEKHDRGYKKVVFEEGDTVFINFCQIIAIAQGFPPSKKHHSGPSVSVEQQA